MAWAQNATKRYGLACDWVAAGNKKSFSPPDRTSQAEDLTELAAFRSIGYVFEAKVFELIADGKPNQAAEAIADVLTFGRRVQSTGIRGYGVGSEIVERNLRMFDLNRRAFAEDGLEKLLKLELIASIPSERIAVEVEIDAMGRFGSAVDAGHLAESKKAIMGFLAKEEREWAWKGIEAFEAIWLRSVVVRTKLRLLNATAAVLLHEVRNYKLPDAYTDAYDPATGVPFFYGKRDDAFVIYSNGTEKTGRVELGTLWEEKR